MLTDRNCVSACDAFSGAVKDLRLGTLVGTRTGGIVAAPAAAYLLDDASLLILPATQDLSAHHELINGIGVAPDYYLPLTAQDLSTGHDPDITKALDPARRLTHGPAAEKTEKARACFVVSRACEVKPGDRRPPIPAATCAGRLS